MSARAPMQFGVQAHLGPARDIHALARFERAILFGAGAGAGEVEKTLRSVGVTIQAFADNSPSKQGTLFRGLPVLAPASLPFEMDDRTAIVIASVYQREIADQLASLGIAGDAIFPFVSPMFADHYGEATVADAGDAIDRVRARLHDTESKAYLDALLRFRWAMDPRLLERNQHMKGFYDYQAAGLGPRPGDHIVDVGAYDGDSAIAYLNRLNGEGRISAMEPMPRNLEALNATIASNPMGDRITPVPFGAGRSPASASLSSEGETDPRATLRTGASSSDIIRIETIDRLFAHDTVDFIKIDIEGHDPDALEGAANVLNRDRPGLAIAAYHVPDHVWRIPLLLDRLCPGYRLYLGHHQAAAYECELFCVHESRAGA